MQLFRCKTHRLWISRGLKERAEGFGTPKLGPLRLKNPPNQRFNPASVVGLVGFAARRGVFVNHAAFHDEYDAPDGRNVFQRIPVESYEVGLKAGDNRAELIGHAERFRS